MYLASKHRVEIAAMGRWAPSQPNEGRGPARGKANEMPQATPSQMALKRSFWKGERRPEQVRRAVCSECGSRWPRGQLSKISRQRRELCRLSKNVSVLGDNWNSTGMAELPLPQYYREQAVRLRQMAKAASSLITRLEYEELATYHEKLAEDVERFIEQRRRKSA